MFKVIFGLASTSVAAVGGTVVYASVDNDFRRLVEDVVPGAGTLFGAVLGEMEPEKSAIPASIKPLPPPPSDVAPSKKRVSVTAAPPPPPRPVEAAPAEPKKSPPVPSPPLERPSFMKSEEKDEPKVQKEAKDEAPKQETKPAKEVKEEKPSAAAEPVKEEAPAPPVKKPAAPKPIPVAEVEEEEFDVAPTAVRVGKDLHRKVAAVREELEAEMRVQMKRQAEVHNDHINDALDTQNKELSRVHLRELDELLENATLSHRQELAAVMGHVRGLQTALENRAEMDHAALEAQELWLACSALQGAVENSSGEVQSVKHELAAVRKILQSKDPYVKAVIDAIPGQVSERGVYSDTSIRERFLRVEKMAKRTAMIGEGDKGSLFKYAISYLQSVFIMDPSTHELPSKHVSVDVEALTTFDLVWLARGSLDRGDLEQAVRYVSLLKGEPGNVSQDWLKEARLLLETKQACRALLVHAAAVGVEAMPQRK
jgi:hypothetical protein